MPRRSNEFLVAENARLCARIDQLEKAVEQLNCEVSGLAAFIVAKAAALSNEGGDDG